MWDCLVKFSTWAEGNSGQIQILIAVVALFFAFLGYRKVLEQIKTSNKQEKEQNQQRNLEIKIELLNLCLSIIQKLYDKKSSLTQLQVANSNTMQDIVDNDVLEEHREFDAALEKQMKTTEGLIKLINETYNKINKLESHDHQKTMKNINSLYTALMMSINEANMFDQLKTEMIVDE